METVDVGRRKNDFGSISFQRSRLHVAIPNVAQGFREEAEAMSVHITETRCGSCAKLEVYRVGGGYHCPNNRHVTFVQPDFAQHCRDYTPKIHLEEWQKEEAQQFLLINLTRKEVTA